MKNSFLKIAGLGSLLVPVQVFAQITPFNPACINARGIIVYLCALLNVVNLAIPVAFGIGVICFLYSAMKFVMNAENDKERDSAKQSLLWGIVALFVGSALWGLVQIVAYTFNVYQGGTIY